jgi:hypothetical protein
MSGDLIFYFSDISSILQIAICIAGIYRALEIRLGFADATYRARALFSAVFLLVILIVNSFNFIPLPNNALGAVVGFLPIMAVILAAFAITDSNVQVAIHSDFFHRAILRWTDLRLFAVAVLFGSGILISSAIATDPLGWFANSPQASDPSWVLVSFYQFFIVAPIVLAYGGLGLIVGSRRTPDRTLKRHIRLLGAAIVSFVLALLFFTIGANDAAVIIGNGLVVVTTYVLYLSAMSLTSLGHKEKEFGAGATN